MVSLPENVQRFANWSGAKLRPQDKPALEVDMPNFVADTEADSAQSANETPTEGLVEQKFERNKAPWKNPNVTLGTAMGLACAVSAVGFFAFNSNFQWPTIGGPTLGNASSASNDDLEPVDHPDGKVQTAAMTTNLGGGLEQDANPSNPFTTTQKPTDKATGKATGKNATTTPGKGTTTPQSPTPASANPAYPTTTASTTASATPTVSMTRRTVTRPTYADYNDDAVTPSRTSSASTNYPRTYNVGYSRSAVSSSGSSTAATRQSTGASSRPAVSTPAPSNSSQPKQTADERRQAAIASTSTMGGASEKVASVQGVASVPVSNPVGQPSQTQGYQEAAYLTSEDAVLSGIPQQLINRSQKAVGRLLMGVAFVPGDTEALNGQPVEVAIEDPLKSGLPADARIEAVVEFPKAEGQLKSAVLRLTPKAIAIGDAEYPLPPGAVILTGENGQPLIAKRQGSEFFRAIGSTVKTVLGGAVGGLSTLAFGNGTGILSGLGGGLNGVGGLSSLGRSSTTQQATEILALRENTAIQINIVKPLTLPAVQTSQIAPDSTHAAVPQPMMFTQNITDAQLMAIANEPLDSAQSVQPTGSVQSEVQNAQ